MPATTRSYTYHVDRISICRHETWYSKLRPAYPKGCVSVIVWTDANSADKIRNDLSQHAGLKAPVLDIRVLDFAKISERLLSVYPALESLLRESQQNLKALSNEKSATPLSDVVRFFVLAAYGGVYLDCDMLLLRQLTPLLANDFFYRWSNQEYCNTAALHFRLGSMHLQPLNWPYKRRRALLPG